jgi:leucyl-tRNA synthetase
MVKDEHGETMSKSKGNVVPPSSVIGPYGADTMRLSILFIAPPEKDFDWDPKAVAGCNRFIKRAWRSVWALADGAADAPVDAAALGEAGKKLYRELNRTGVKCTDDFDRGQFNTAISAVMEMVNAADDYLRAVPQDVCEPELRFAAASDIVRCLAPICPHWAEELWHEALHQQTSVYHAAWPEFDAEAAKADVVEIAVQVCGKVRQHIEVPREISAEELQELGLAAVAKWIEGKTVVKVVAIPGRLVNVVAK